MGNKILFVDDSESIREVIDFTLQNAGFDVFIAVDGADAKQYLDGRDIDLVITDLHMPNLDGIELIKFIRSSAKYKCVPILFLTTESQQAKKQEARAAGATGWIVKPFAPQKLLSAIKKIIK